MDPVAVATPFSDPFWLLAPEEIGRAEDELRRLAAEADRINRWLAESELREDSPRYIAAVGRWFEVNREAYLLHLLRAASRQYRR